METAPKDQTVIEILSRNFGRASAGTTVYRARWLEKAGIWLNWDNLNEELCYGRRWRMPPDEFMQPRHWTDEEQEQLADLHAEKPDRLIPFEDFIQR